MAEKPAGKKPPNKNPAKKVRRIVVGDSEMFNSAGQRIIQHDAGKLPRILNHLGKALAEYRGDVFSYTGRLVRIYPAPATTGAGVHRPRGALILHPVDGPHLTELATCAAIHERFDARAGADSFNHGYRPIDCPRRVADAYLSRGNWPELRALAGFIEAPTITSDGRLIDKPGYDKDTNLFLAPSVITGYTAPPAKPTLAEADKCKRILLDLVARFAFVDDADRAATLAGIITGLLRRILPAAPMVAITAPAAGTGKTLLAETFAIVTTGRRASVLSLGEDAAEAEKRLVGVLLAGDACIVLDNIDRPLKSALLCQVVTQQFVCLRPLGGSVMPDIPTHAMIIATGNNLAIVGDLKRRTMLIRMDAGVERPEQRTFDRDHLEDVFAQRGALIRAALTISLAYLAAGAPALDGLHPHGGFEAWDRLVRRPLVWLGLPDPIKASEGLRDLDPDLDGMRSLFGAWIDLFGDQPATAAEVVAVGMSTAMSGNHTNPELYDALQFTCAEKPNPRRLGGWLRAHKDRIIDGMQIKQAGRKTHTKVALWTVQSAGSVGSSGVVSSLV